MKELTNRQADVLKFIEAFSAAYERPPTRADISKAFGWKSPNAAQDHINALERKGRLFVSPGIARGLRVA